MPGGLWSATRLKEEHDVDEESGHCVSRGDDAGDVGGPGDDSTRWPEDFDPKQSS
jgi:hypothetical protein